MGQNGGARPGAGRKPKAEKFKQPIAKAEKRIADRLPELIDNMLLLANGVLVEETNIVTGKPQIYKKPPDRAANVYLIDRIMGKPVERQEQGEPGDFIALPPVREVVVTKQTDEPLESDEPGPAEPELSSGPDEGMG